MTAAASPTYRVGHTFPDWVMIFIASVHAPDRTVRCARLNIGTSWALRSRWHSSPSGTQITDTTNEPAPRRTTKEPVRPSVPSSWARASRSRTTGAA